MKKVYYIIYSFCRPKYKDGSKKVCKGGVAKEIFIKIIFRHNMYDFTIRPGAGDR